MAFAFFSPEPMNNPHIIVGEPRICLCGTYHGKSVGCIKILDALDRLVSLTKLDAEELSPEAEDILLLNAVIKPLVQECN